ncbi:MAG: TNT antitoxin family protein [Mycobacterium pseudokansasii]|uniref:Imm61 family immunity protein n=1 Tax=Mycobacterium pseudokansasii TaxID=2341080 RepID=UPI0023F368F2|nr:Imm61 family immunity protein [Mycobacterium pseudokansasii]MBY0387386.1 TNT antitoxin family protein [Mycobacterium pseudokansasii]
MTAPVDLSLDLYNWIRSAGLDMTQGSQTDDGRTVIWNKGGEVRYFVSYADGYSTMTSSNRMAPERFHLSSSTMPILEKYLYGRFGNSIRKQNGLGWVRKPCAIDELQQAYTIGKVTFYGRERDALIDESGTVLAIGEIDRLVELSHYLGAPVSAIKDSFFNPQGKPLFSPLGER